MFLIFGWNFHPETIHLTLLAKCSCKKLRLNGINCSLNMCNVHTLHQWPQNDSARILWWLGVRSIRKQMPQVVIMEVRMPKLGMQTAGHSWFNSPLSLFARQMRQISDCDLRLGLVAKVCTAKFAMQTFVNVKSSPCFCSKSKIENTEPFSRESDGMIIALWLCRVCVVYHIGQFHLEKSRES